MANLPAIIEKEGLPTIKNAQELITKVHEVFKPEHFNVMVPKALNISPRVKIAIQIVELDANPNIYKNKDFWGFPKAKDKESPDDEFMFHARALWKLAAAANVQFIPSDTGVIYAKYDDDNRPLIIRAKASCQTIDSLGNNRIGSGDYEYNYNNDISDPRFEKTEWQNKKKMRLGKPDYDQINRRRNVADRLAITGAKKRALFDCLGVDGSISRRDVGKPFIVPCVIDDIDYNDPIIRKAIAERSVGAQRDVYVDGDGQKLQPVKAESQVINGGREVNTQTGEVKEPATAATQSEQPAPEQPPDQPETVKQTRADFESDWASANSSDRAKEIKRLAGIASHDITTTSNGKPQETPEKWSKENQMKWLIWLAQKAGIISG